MEIEIEEYFFLKLIQIQQQKKKMKKYQMFLKATDLKPDNTKVQKKTNFFVELFIDEDDVFDIDDLNNEDKNLFQI